MAINIALEPARPVDPTTEPIARNFVGHDPQASDAILWDANRGVYRLDERAQGEAFATFSVDGTIRVVAELEGLEQLELHGEEVFALMGRVLPVGDQVHDALVGREVPAGDQEQGPVSYFATPELDQMTAADRFGDAAAARTFLVTLADHEWVWTPEDEADIVARTMSGAPHREPWTVGGRRIGIRPGDRVFMLQSAGGVSGMRASGVVMSPIYQSEHYDDPRRMDNYIDIEWDVMVPFERLLPLEVLRSEVPGYAWTPRKGGVELHEPMATQMEQLWADHLGEDAPCVKRRGPGWAVDDQRRRIIDAEARRRIIELYREHGWEVVDTHDSRPYAAVATRGDEVLHLFAKGVETAQRPVLFFPDEAAHIQANEGTCRLGVLSDVVFEQSQIAPGSGVFVVEDAVLRRDDLDPVLLKWTPPAKLDA